MYDGYNTAALLRLLHHIASHSVVLCCVWVCRKVLPPMILGQLLYMAVAKNDINIAAETAPTSKKQGKKLQQQIKRMAGREQYGVTWRILTEDLLYNLEFSDDFDSLVSIACGCMSSLRAVAVHDQQRNCRTEGAVIGLLVGAICGEASCPASTLLHHTQHRQQQQRTSVGFASSIILH